ncbi:MAG: DUF4190 domain-containing protein [Thermoleophilia bacterium]
MSFPGQPTQTGSGAVASLVLGVLGIVLCPICAPIAWSLGRTAEREIDASGGRLDGRGLATAGKITGIIGTVLLILYVLVFVVFFVVLGVVFEQSVSEPLESVPR